MAGLIASDVRRWRGVAARTVPAVVRGSRHMRCFGIVDMVPLLSVLVVDDDPVILDLIELLLVSSGGFKVVSVTSARVALERIRNDPKAFDIVLTDHNMPGLNGLDLVRELPQKMRPATIVVTSGDLHRRLMDDYMHVGVHAFIEKPFVPNELPAAVRDAFTASITRKAPGSP